MKAALGRLRRSFEDRFERRPEVAARAPGRVNLIGEHIDYNGGLVFPAAIDRNVALVAGRSPDGKTFSLYSKMFDQRFEFDGDSLPEERAEEGWPNYFLAVLEQLSNRGYEIPPLNVVIDGDVPAGGSGLSSSAAYA